jgi:hypothetical protein
MNWYVYKIHSRYNKEHAFTRAILFPRQVLIHTNTRRCSPLIYLIWALYSAGFPYFDLFFRRDANVKSGFMFTFLLKNNPLEAVFVFNLLYEYF